MPRTCREAKEAWSEEASGWLADACPAGIPVRIEAIERGTFAGRTFAFDRAERSGSSAGRGF